MQRLAATGYGNNWTLAYQSRVGPVEWLRPYTDDTIRQLCQEGVDALVVVPISFVSEHLETLTLPLPLPLALALAPALAPALALALSLSLSLTVGAYPAPRAGGGPRLLIN